MIEIGGSAFENCNSLRIVEILLKSEVGIQSLNVSISAFRNCPQLELVDFGGADVVVDAKAFENDVSLVEVHARLAGGYVGAEAFRNCSALTGDGLLLGASVLTIGERAFQGCSSLVGLGSVQDGTGSCNGWCGGRNEDYGCYCDTTCGSYNDCCEDYSEYCTTEAPTQDPTEAPTQLPTQMPIQLPTEAPQPARFRRLHLNSGSEVDARRILEEQSALSLLSI